jgi:LytS/YehU family sensor histidine kinase
VRNTDDGAPVVSTANGTGLERLRERLRVLYGDAASLTAGRLTEGVYEAVLLVPRRGGDE